MSVTFLTTKLNIPPERTDLIPRTRLYSLLEEGLRPGCRGILISAPAGFGKTALLSDWIGYLRRVGEKEPLNFAWLTLDETDNNPVRFFSYLIAAWQTIGPSVGEAALDMLQMPLGGVFSLQSALVALLNDLGGLSGRYALVLDDFHLIDNAAIHEGLNFFIDHLPPRVHLLVSSRVDPPLAVAQWRGRGQLAEIRQNDLRFTLEETAMFLHRHLRLNPNKNELEMLDARAEGWIAGLQLAALSMREGVEIGDLLGSFSGHNRFILDYLAEEVLQRQPEEVQSFLAETAMLERMNGSLCDTVTGRDDGAVMLELLEKANLFVVPMDQERSWYRYHRLFADFLRYRGSMTDSSKEHVRLLHRRASQWFELQGMGSEAVTHALEAGDFERVAELIEGTVRQTILGRETGMALGWFEALPPEIIRSRAKLSLAYAWTLMGAGKLDAAETLTSDALAIAADDPETRSEAAAVLAMTLMLAGRLHEAIELAEEARGNLSADAYFLRGIIAFDLGLAHDLMGRAKESIGYYREAYAVCQHSGNALISGLALVQLADLTVLAGRLSEADGLYEKTLRLMADSGKWFPQIAGMAYIGLGKLRYERNDLTTAMELFQKCAALDMTDFRITGLIHQALSCAAMGEESTTLALLRQVSEASSDPILSMGTLRVAEALRARILRRLGNVAAAARWIEDYRRRVDDGLGFLRQIEGISCIQLLLTQGRFDDAEPLIQPLLEAADISGLTGNRLELLIHKAALVAHSGRRHEAASLLKDALELAEPEGYIQLWIEAGDVVLDLLDELRRAGFRTNYIDTILRASTASRRKPKPETVGVLEPLSERELEVLRLIAQGLSNQAIADKLIVAVSTVKTHINNIYGKLGVRTRTQALAKGQEAGII